MAKTFSAEPYTNADKVIRVSGPGDLYLTIDNDDVDTKLIRKLVPVVLNALDAVQPEIDRITGEHYAEQNKLFKVAELVEDGLSVDGSHHKQYFLSEIAKELDLDVYLPSYEEGIAP